MNTTTIDIFDHSDQNAEWLFLEQIINEDGRDNVILAEEDIINGSGRKVGTTYTVTEDTVEFIAECIRLSEDD